MRFALILLVACGSPPAVQPERPAVRPPPPAPAPVTCGDAGTILRGPLDNKEAGPSKEAAIASACLHDKWSAELLRCVATTADAKTCLDQLGEAQQTGYNKTLTVWAETFNGTFDPIGKAAQVTLTDCAQGIGDVAAYTPAIAHQGEERAFATELRRSTVDALCRSGWGETAKQCFVAGQPTDTCRARLPRDMQRVLTDQLATVDHVVTRALAARAKPAATYDCKQVVAQYYSTAAWDQNYPPPREAAAAAERRKVIAERRTKLGAACQQESWNATARACLVAGAGTACFRGIRVPPERWGFAPPLEIGIPECDAYVARMAAFNGCGQIPQHLRTQRNRDFEIEVARWMSVRADQRNRFAGACKAADDAVTALGKSFGCAL